MTYLFYKAGLAFQRTLKSETRSLTTATDNPLLIGDFVTETLKLIGVDKLITNKDDCGCKKRQERLNEIGKEFYERHFN